MYDATSFTWATKPDLLTVIEGVQSVEIPFNFFSTKQKEVNSIFWHLEYVISSGILQSLPCQQFFVNDELDTNSTCKNE